MTASIAQLSWFARLRSLLGFGASSVQAPIAAPSTSTSSSKPPAPPISKPPNVEMHISAVASVAARIPSIKFVGARLPRPHFDRSKLPPLPSIPIAGNVGGGSLLTQRASTIGSVGKIPRGQGIDEARLPLKFRRPMISQEECDAINAGGSYGLVTEAPPKRK